ncbi:hypothetical protein WUBG_05860, partial [Wuchereria bancrofti]
MDKDDENQDMSRQIIRRPRILARRISKRSSNTSDRIETATPLNPKLCSTEKEESGNEEMDEASDTESIFSSTELTDMHKDDENQRDTSAEEPARRMIRRPRILAQRTWKKLSNTISSIETTDLDPKPCSTEKREYGNAEMDEASNAE